MSRRVTRRTVLGVLGTGVAAFTGAATKPSECPVFDGSGDCGPALSLSGPGADDPVSSNPRFVLRNDSDAAVTVDPGAWSVYRRGRDWERVASADAGRPFPLGPGDETAWVLLLDGDASGRVFTADTATRTRYVGPVSLPAAEYTFTVTGRRGDDRVAVGAPFAVE